MKNKGFTLIELLGTIVILAIIALLAFPAVLSMLNNSQNETDEASKQLMISAARNYVNNHVDEFPKALKSDTVIKEYGSSGEITGQVLVDNGYISSNTINSKKNCEMLKDVVKVTSNYKKYFYEYISKNNKEKCA